jgi:O-antigen/teichoic acid export membrane protein
MRAMARAPRERDQVAAALLQFRCIGALLLVGALFGAAALGPARPLPRLMLLAGPGLAGEMLRTVYDAVLISRNRPRSAALLGALLQLLAIGVGVGVLECGFGLTELIAARALVALLGGAIAIALLLRSHHLQLRTPLHQLRRLAHEAAPFGALGMLLVIDDRLDLLMLATIPGRVGGGLLATTLATGIYGVPLRLMQILLVPLAPIRTALVPSISGLIDTDPTRVGELYRATTRILIATLLLPALLILPPLAAPLLRIAAPPSYGEGVVALRLLLLAALLLAAQAPATAVASVSRRTSHLLAPVSLALLLNGLCNALLIPHWSYNGAALATLFAALVSLLFRLVTAEAVTGGRLREHYQHLCSRGALLWGAAAMLLLGTSWMLGLPSAGALVAATLYLLAFTTGRVLAAADQQRVSRLLRSMLRR